LYSQNTEHCLFHKYRDIQEREEQMEGDEDNRKKNNTKGEK
jgi:hypothetical protein